MNSKKILTIISEYNPLHFGHVYQLEKSIELVNPDYKIAIISGNFVQRGEPSLLNKWEKAKSAMFAGFDLIIELPVIYSISSAENFANGAIKIADLLGTTHLSFGSECGDVEKLMTLSELISDNEDFVALLKKYIADGYSYPKSQELAILDLFGDTFKDVCKPNNILGLEYLRNLKAINSGIIPVTIPRNNEFSSSSDIREKIRNSDNFSDDIELPDFLFNILKENHLNSTLVYSLKTFEKEIFYRLRTMTDTDFSRVPDLQENMVANLKKAIVSTNSLEELISILKNKSITHARIQRILLYILLQITKEEMNLSKTITPYVRVLAMNDNGKKIISNLDGNVNLITSLKSFEDKCENRELLNLLNIDKRATDIYTLAYKNDSFAKLDYTKRVITF